MAQDAEIALPRGLEDIDAAFMTQVLRASGAIGPGNSVVSQEEQGVGMTAGYFSAIKRIECRYAEPTDAPTTFVVKAWPQLEIAPKESIRAMFIKDIKGYQQSAEQFYPRPITHLATFDAENDLWALVMEDACAFADHKVHEAELSFDEVMRMIPGLVDVAVAWEGADQGERAEALGELGVLPWSDAENLSNFKALMPCSALIFDRLGMMGDSPLIGTPTWPENLGGPGFCTEFVRKSDAFYASAHPDNGATCTLSHGDLRGDNIFFCNDHPAYPGGWLCIDFQQMFRGPVPSDLAYLMSSGTVLPDVYAEESLGRILRAFHSDFVAKTRTYPDYSFEAFVDEFTTMATISFTYFLGFGVPYFQGGAHRNELPMRVELGTHGVQEADLTPEELRQRMWWRKAWRNQCELFRTLKLRERLASLPENATGMGEWGALPPHLVVQ